MNKPKNPILDDAGQGWVSLICYEADCDCGFVHVQPERSKREDLELKVIYKEPEVENMSQPIRSKYKLAKKALRCGALNSMET
jgi:hypothetical protein